MYLGLKQWLAEPVDLTQTRPEQKSVRAIYWRGFFVSLTNPKTLLFYGAFFPQFIVSQHNAVGQILLLSTTFLFLAVLLDSTWAIAAARVRGLLSRHGRLRNRAAGGMLMGAAVGLAMARRK